MATKAEIRNRVLKKVRRLKADGTADTNDATDVEAAYDSVYATLSEFNWVTWASGDDIPVEAEIPIINIVANEVADEFGVPEQRLQRFQAHSDAGVINLAALASAEPTDQRVRAEYF